jgi:PAS domain S-box-containing protein
MSHKVSPTPTHRAASANADFERLRARLKEAEETLRAIRLGEADAVVVAGPDGPRVYTLVTADQSYRTLVEQMNEAALILSVDGIILYCNGRLTALLAGPSPAGRPLLELVLPADSAVFFDLLQRARSGEAEGELRLRRADGSPVPVHLSLSVLRTGGFSGLAGIATDLTEQKRRGKAAERERLANAVLEFAGTAILVCDAGGRVVRANRAALALCGAGSVGLPFEEALPIGVAYDDVRDGRWQTQREVMLPVAGSAPRCLLISARRIGNGAREDGWWVVTLADLTDRKRAEEALRAAMEEADAANRAKSDFLSVVSHELRTPLNSVLGYADLLQAGLSGGLSDEQRTHVQRIEASARHQLTLIEEILGYARIEAGHEELHLDQVDVAELIREVSDLIRPGADAKGLIFRIDVVPNADVRIITDPDKLRRVLINLLANATKFTRNGAVEVSAAWEEDGRLALEVCDTGPGIEEDHLDLIWKPFTQVDPSPTRESPGTGLGLAIVRQLVAFIGGEVEVHTTVGLGSTFIVRLPRSGPAGGLGGSPS